MFSRSMTKLAIAAAAAGTICTLGAASAFAAPSAGWSGAKGPVPRAITNNTPTISSISFPSGSKIGQGVIAGWRARGNSGDIFYTYRAPGLNKGKWSKKLQLAGANASSGPVFRPYTDPSGHNCHSRRVDRPPGPPHLVQAGRDARQTARSTGPRRPSCRAQVQFTNTTAAPSVLFTNHVFRVILSWRGPANHIRFVVGVPSGRGFNWSNLRDHPRPRGDLELQGRALHR